MEEPFQPYLDSLGKRTMTPSIFGAKRRISAEAFVSEGWISCKLYYVIEHFA